MKKFDPKVLPYLAATVQAVLFAIAGNAYFENFGWLVGLLMGVIVNASLAVSASRISEIARQRKPLAWISLVALFSLSPAVICSSLGWSVANLVWSLAADLAIVLTGATTGKSLLSHEQPAKVAQAKPAKKKSRSAEFRCNHAGAGCDRKFASQNAANAHARRCAYKPMAVMVEEKVTRA